MASLLKITTNKIEITIRAVERWVNQCINPSNKWTKTKNLFNI